MCEVNEFTEFNNNGFFWIYLVSGSVFLDSVIFWLYMLEVLSELGMLLYFLLYWVIGVTFFCFALLICVCVVKSSSGLLILLLFLLLHSKNYDFFLFIFGIFVFGTGVFDLCC